MANAVAEISGIEITNVAKISGKTDANIQAIGGREFTGVLPDAHTLIATATASSSATLEFTSGIDSTYDVYEFVFTNTHPADNSVWLGFQVNAAGGSGFNETITSTVFRAYVSESGSGGNLEYRGGTDQAQGTAYQRMTESTGNPNDGSVSGVLTLYAPSSTTYVKHFMARTIDMYNDTSVSTFHIAGYINTTTAIDEISFKFASGNIDAGVIKMYGLAKS